MYRRVLLAALVAIGIGGVVAGCSATPHPISAAAALDAYDASDIGDATQTSHMGGYSISRADRTVTAYRTAAATADDLATVRGVGLPAGFSLRMRTVHRSWAALEHLEEKLPSLLPHDLRTILSEVDIDTAANGLDVGFTHVTADSSTALRTVLGDSLAKVFRAPPVTY